MESKIKSIQEIEAIVQDLRRKNNLVKIVTTCGAFDLLHTGHLFSLESAKSLGDCLIICLNSDTSVKQYKSIHRPIIPEAERARMLSALTVVDYVVLFNETDPRELLKRIKPNYHVKSETGYKGIEAEVVEPYGKIVLIKDVPFQSTSNIIERIRALPSSK